MTKIYAVIGDPIDHSMSPVIHNAAFVFLGMDCSYIAYRIEKGDLKNGLDSLFQIDIGGFNVTIPHKVDMMSYLDEVDKDCKLIGATNTVTIGNNDVNKKTMKGYNTDMEGFLEPIKRRKLEIKGTNVLILGAGGAARAIVAAFAKQEAEKITIGNRTKEKAKEISEFANTLGTYSDFVTLEEAGEHAGKYRFIVNSTSVGLKYNDESPISTKNIGKNSVVYDIVYRPMETKLLMDSKKNNASLIYGWEMLLGQAQRSFEIWTGRNAPYEAMKLALLGRF